MLKRIFISIVAALIASTVVFYGHNAILSSAELKISFSLFNSYVFHLVFFIIAVLAIEVIFMLNPAQLGFAYLGIIFTKLGAFIVVFKGVLFDQEALPMETRLSLVVPLLIYILPEAFYCARMLKKVDANS
ncbi:MAG: DUF6168 family protein [Bacteroidota bacterium]